MRSLQQSVSQGHTCCLTLSIFCSCCLVSHFVTTCIQWQHWHIIDTAQAGSVETKFGAITLSLMLAQIVKMIQQQTMLWVWHWHTVSLIIISSVGHKQSKYIIRCLPWNQVYSGISIVPPTNQSWTLVGGVGWIIWKWCSKATSTPRKTTTTKKTSPKVSAKADSTDKYDRRSVQNGEVDEEGKRRRNLFLLSTVDIILILLPCVILTLVTALIVGPASLLSGGEECTTSRG